MNVTTEKPRPNGTPPSGFWSGDLGYRQALVVVITAFLIGLFYQWRMPWGVNVPPKLAWTGGLGATVAIALVTLLWRHNRVLEWLTSIPFAIVSTVAVCLVAGVGAVVPEETLRAKLGVGSVYSSWPFAMVMFTMLFNLIGVTARRCTPLSYRNLCFTLNHLGLTIAVLGGALSASSLERARIVLNEGQPTNMAEDVNGKPLPLPFTTTLNRFTLETFAPVLVMARVNPETGEVIKESLGEKLASAGATETIDGFTIKILEYHPRAVMMDGTVRPMPELRGAPPAARVEVADPSGKKVAEGWINSSGAVPMGGHVIPVEMTPLQIGPDRMLGMPQPAPRAFRSSVDIKYNGRTETREISVNKPLSIGGYRLYQVSYDGAMGAASTVSVLEAVRDTGLPVVYTGLYLMIAGAALMLWNGVGTGATVTSSTLPMETKAPRKEVTA